jgi:hypothetical protein
MICEMSLRGVAPERRDEATFSFGLTVNSPETGDCFAATRLATTYSEKGFGLNATGHV